MRVHDAHFAVLCPTILSTYQICGLQSLGSHWKMACISTSDSPGEHKAFVAMEVIGNDDGIW